MPEETYRNVHMHILQTFYKGRGTSSQWTGGSHLVSTRTSVWLNTSPSFKQYPCLRVQKNKHFLFNFASSIKTTVIEDWTTTCSMLLTFHLSLYIVLKNSSSCYVLVSLMTLWNIYSNNTALKQPNVTHLAFGYMLWYCPRSCS